jgi:5-methylcytosine-specific restriction endonuclease McrA
VKQAARDWGADNRDVVRERNHARYMKRRVLHPIVPMSDDEREASRRAAARKWKRANRDQLREYLNNWMRSNPQKNSEYHNRRRALIAAATGDHTAADVRVQYERQNGRCLYCEKKVGEDYHVDHVIPLSKGGSNGPENIVIACSSCNCKKKDKMPAEFCGRLC